MQYRAKQPVGRPSKKYWKFIVHFLLEIGVINSHILYKETPVANLAKKSSLLNFTVELASLLIGGFSCRYKPTYRVRAPITAAGLIDHREERLDRKRSNCKWCQNHAAAKKTKLVFSGCSTCSVHLCKGGCFQAYHNMYALPM